ncbi:hypothetical protein B0H17DRAFT_1328615 [Mycena rosella]|uniref:Uncharacterized protein n=1 Tax=Mycena rosella TaxID=1033263 RepID=A0AAD7DRS8_MYCRO|nr:hypothetical protein B0H17DRAFT_1328615 [Mycena rosella]
MSSLMFSADDGPVAPFFQPFSLPNLTSLGVATFQLSGIDLLDLHARSNFPLTRLELADLRLDADGLLPFLRCLPTLRSLALVYCDCVEDRLFDALTWKPGPSPSSEITLLHLTHLTLETHADLSRGISPSAWL